jgi:hypothetical protein
MDAVAFLPLGANPARLFAGTAFGYYKPIGSRGGKRLRDRGTGVGESMHLAIWLAHVEHERDPTVVEMVNAISERQGAGRD